MRVCFFGTRQLVLTREESLMQFHRSRTPGVVAIPFHELWTYFRDLTQETMSLYLSQQGSGCTFTCTVAAKEFLYTPPAYVVVERGQAEPCIGIRSAIVRTVDYDNLSKVSNYLEAKNAGAAAGSKATVLQLAVQSSKST